VAQAPDQVLPEAENEGGVATLQPGFNPTRQPVTNHQRREVLLKITDVARDKIKELMQQHPEKHLRIVFEGFG
jgi:hypothetical protein